MTSNLGNGASQEVNTPKESIEGADMTDPTNPMDDSDRLKPCPFCGSEAEMLTVPEDHPDAGAVFAQCTHSACMASSALVYPLMDDVKPLLLERWNRRTVGAALTPAPAQPEPPTAAGVEPVAFIGTRSLQWLKDHPAGETHTALFGPKDDRPSAELLSPLYATPPTLTDAQCDAIREAVSLRSTYTIDEYRARVRAAVGGAK